MTANEAGGLTSLATLSPGSSWVSELVSRLDEGLLAARESDEPGGDPGAPDADLPETDHETRDPTMPDGFPDGVPTVQASASQSVIPGPGEAADAAGPAAAENAAGFFDAVLGWLTDFLATLFGGGTGDGDPEQEAVTEPLPAPGSYVPDPAPDMSEDLVFIEYLPEVPVEEGIEGDDFGDGETIETF